MAISLQRARRYCTASETALVAASIGQELAAMPAARVRAKLDRARKLRDKFRGLAERQRREIRGKGEPRGRRPAQSNEATLLKQQIFAETVERFEAALGASETPVAAKRAKKTTKTTTHKKASLKKAAGKASPERDAKPITKKTAKKLVRKAVARKKAGKKAGKKVSKKKTARASMLAESARLSVVPNESKGPRTARTIAKGGQTRKNAHVSSRGRRSQAKRDSR